MVVNITHDERVPSALKGHSILAVNISFKDAWSALYRMTAKPGMPEVPVKKIQRFVQLALYRPGQLLVLPDEPFGELDRHYLARLASLVEVSSAPL